MKRTCLVPTSINAALSQFAFDFAETLEGLLKEDFIVKWSALAYLEPGLHPDGYDHEDSGWPEYLKPYAAEAWRRNRLGELSDDDLYCCDAQWAGLYDRMNAHTEDETVRRQEIASGLSRISSQS